MANIFTKFFNGEIKKKNQLEKLADKVDALASEMEKLSDAQLKAKTDEFKK